MNAEFGNKFLFTFFFETPRIRPCHISPQQAGLAMTSNGPIQLPSVNTSNTTHTTSKFHQLPGNTSNSIVLNQQVIPNKSIPESPTDKPSLMQRNRQEDRDNPLMPFGFSMTNELCRRTIYKSI